MALAWSAEATPGKVVAEKASEGCLFFSTLSLQDAMDGRREIVIADALRNAAKVLEGSNTCIDFQLCQN